MDTLCADILKGPDQEEKCSKLYISRKRNKEAGKRVGTKSLFFSMIDVFESIEWKSVTDYYNVVLLPLCIYYYHLLKFFWLKAYEHNIS